MPSPQDIQRALDVIRKTREQTGGYNPERQYQEPSDAWREAYAREHGGKLPGQVPGESELEAYANLLWSQDFLRVHGRGPDEAEWIAHWQDYSTGRDTTWESYLNQAKTYLEQQIKPKGGGAPSGRTGGGVGNIPSPPTSPSPVGGRKSKEVTYQEAVDQINRMFGMVGWALDKTPFGNMGFGSVAPVQSELEEQLARRKARTNIPAPPTEQQPTAAQEGADFLRREAHLVDQIIPPPPPAPPAPPTAEDLRQQWEQSDKGILRNFGEMVAGGIADAFQLAHERDMQIASEPIVEGFGGTLKNIAELEAKGFINTVGLLANILQAIGDPTASLAAAGIQELRDRFTPSTEERLRQIEEERRQAMLRAQELEQYYNEIEGQPSNFTDLFTFRRPAPLQLSERDQYLISKSPLEILIDEEIANMPPLARRIAENNPQGTQELRDRALGRLLGQSEEFRDKYDWTTLLQYGTGNILPSIINDPRRLDTYFEALARTGNRLEAQQEAEDVLSELPFELVTDPFDLYGYFKSGTKTLGKVLGRTAEDVAEEAATRATREIVEELPATGDLMQPARSVPTPEAPEGFLGAMARKQAEEAPAIPTSIDTQTRVAQVFKEEADYWENLRRWEPPDIAKVAPTNMLESAVSSFAKREGIEESGSIIRRLREQFAAAFIQDPEKARLFVMGNKGVMDEYGEAYRDLLSRVLLTEEGFNAPTERMRRYMQNVFEAMMKEKNPDLNPKTWVNNIAGALTRAIRYPEKVAPEKIVEYLDTLKRIRADIERFSGGTYTLDFTWKVSSGEASVVPSVKGIKIEIVPTELAQTSSVAEKATREVATEAVQEVTEKATREATQTAEDAAEELLRKAVDDGAFEKATKEATETVAEEVPAKTPEELFQERLRRLEGEISAKKRIFGGKLPREVVDELQKKAREIGTAIDPHTGELLTPEEYFERRELFNRIIEPRGITPNDKYGNYNRYTRMVFENLPQETVRKLLDPTLNPEGIFPTHRFPKGVALPDWAVRVVDKFSTPFVNGKLVKFIREFMDAARKEAYGGFPWVGHVVQDVKTGELGIVVRMRRDGDNLRLFIAKQTPDGVVITSKHIDNFKYVGELQRETWEEIVERVGKDAPIPKPKVTPDNPEPVVEAVEKADEVVEDFYETATEAVKESYDAGALSKFTGDRILEAFAEARRLDFEVLGKIPEDAVDDSFLRAARELPDAVVHELFDGKRVPVKAYTLGEDEVVEIPLKGADGATYKVGVDSAGNLRLSGDVPDDVRKVAEALVEATAKQEGEYSHTTKTLLALADTVRSAIKSGNREALSVFEPLGMASRLGIYSTENFQQLLSKGEEFFQEVATVLLGHPVERPSGIRLLKGQYENPVEFTRAIGELVNSSPRIMAGEFEYYVLRDAAGNVIGVAERADVERLATLAKIGDEALVEKVVSKVSDEFAEAVQTLERSTKIESVAEFATLVEQLETPPTKSLVDAFKQAAERFAELRTYTYDESLKRWVKPDGTLYEYKLADGSISYSIREEAAELVATLRNAVAESLSESTRKRIGRVLPNWIPVEKTETGWKFGRTRPPTNYNPYRVVGEMLDEAEFAEKVIAPAIEVAVDRARLSPTTSNLLTLSMYDDFIATYSKIVGEDSGIVRRLMELRRPVYDMVREDLASILKNAQDAIKREGLVGDLGETLSDEAFAMTYKTARSQLANYMEQFSKMYAELLGVDEVSAKKARALIDLFTGYKSSGTLYSGPGFLTGIRPTWRWVGVGGKPIRALRRWYSKGTLLYGLIGAVGLGAAYTTPLGDVLIERDENGKLKGFIPDVIRMYAESVGAQLQEERSGRFSWVDTLWDTSMAFFNATNTWANMSAGMLINTLQAHAGKDDWVSQMILREDLTDDQRQALLYALGVAFSGDEAVQAVYNEILTLGHQPSAVELQEIYDRHRDPFMDFVGTVIFDPLKIVNLGTVFKTGTAATALAMWRKEGELPEYFWMGYREFQQWRNAQKLIEAGENEKVWSLMFSKAKNILYPSTVKVARAQRRADMMIESALGTMPITLENYQQVVNIVFQELARIDGDVSPIIRHMNPDRMARAIGKALANAPSEELEKEAYLRDIILRVARQMSRDTAYEVLGVSRKATGSMKSVRGVSGFIRAALSRLLLNSLNFGFHITNTLGDIGTTLILASKQSLAPEADGYLSLFNIRRMRQFFQERFGLVPSVVDEAFDILGEEKSHTLFGETPILKNIPFIRDIPQPETLSSVRVYTIGVSHWFPKFYHAGVDATIEPLLRDLGIEQADLIANIALVVKGSWKEEDIHKNVFQVLRSYGYKAEDAVRISDEVAGNVAPVLWRARMAALAGADELRKQTIHHYWNKSNVDSLIELFLPYQYWYSRGILRWTTGILEEPTILSNYYKLERLMLEGLNGNLDDPEYVRRNPSLPTSANPYLGEAVAAMTDKLVIALYPDITPENVDKEAIYVNIVDKLLPVRNLYAMFGSEYEPNVEAYDTNIVTNMITAGGRFGPALSPLAPVLAAGAARVLGKDISNIKYLIEPTIPFAQDRVLQGASLRARDTIEDILGEDSVGPYGWTMTPKYREYLSNIVGAISGSEGTFWGYSMPDYYYKETTRRIAEDVEAGNLTVEEALQLIRDQDIGDPKYREYVRKASMYYANRGDVSAVFGILARYDTHTDIRDLRDQLYELAMVKDENGNPVVDENGEVVWDFEQPEVVKFIQEHPGASVFSIASKNWIERQARAATTLIWDYASDYTRRQFALAWKLRAAQANPDVHSIKADPETLDLWMQYLEGKLPNTVLQKFQEGTASPAEVIAISRELDKFRLVFTNPELEDQRMEVEAMIDKQVQERYPRYALLNSLYWYLRSDQNNPEAAKIFLENNPELAEAWEYRRTLAEQTDLFPITPTERAYYNLVDPPSESQKEFAKAIGFDPERLEDATSQELANFITQRKREAMEAAGIQNDVELEYIQSQVAKAEDLESYDERQRLLESLLTPAQLEKWEKYKEALYTGESDYRGSRILLAIDLGMSEAMARRATPQAIEAYIEARYQRARAAAGVPKEVLDAIQDLAAERGWDVLTDEEQAILQRYYEALGKARPVTKDRIELAMELGLPAERARTITAEELEDFIDRRFDEIAQEKAVRQTNFNNAAASVGYTPEQMSNIIDLKNDKGWDDLTIGEAIALQRFYLTYYGNHPDPEERTYTQAFYQALETVGATEDQIVVLLARKKKFGWNSLSRSEKDLIRRFENLWDAYD